MNTNTNSGNVSGPKAEALAFEHAPINIVNSYQRGCSMRFWAKVRVGTRLTGRGNARLIATSRS